MKKYRPFLIPSLLILVVLLGAAVFLFAQERTSVIEKTSKDVEVGGAVQEEMHKEASKPPDIVFSEFAGVYTSYPYEGAEVQVSIFDETHILLTGTAVLEKSDRTPSEQGLERKIGTVNGMVFIDSLNPHIYADPKNPECSLKLYFWMGDLEIAGGDGCDASVANFKGMYQKIR